MPLLANKALSINFKLESKPDNEENEMFTTEGLTTDTETQVTCSDKTDNSRKTESAENKM